MKHFLCGRAAVRVVLFYLAEGGLGPSTRLLLWVFLEYTVFQHLIYQTTKWQNWKYIFQTCVQVKFWFLWQDIYVGWTQKLAGLHYFDFQLNSWLCCFHICSKFRSGYNTWQHLHRSLARRVTNLLNCSLASYLRTPLYTSCPFRKCI